MFWWVSHIPSFIMPVIGRWDADGESEHERGLRRYDVTSSSDSGYSESDHEHGEPCGSNYPYVIWEWYMRPYENYLPKPHLDWGLSHLGYVESVVLCMKRFAFTPILGFNSLAPQHCHLRSSSDSYGSVSDSEATSSQSSGGSGDDEGDGIVDLTSERLVALQPAPGKSKNAYAKRGGSVKRVKHALSHPVCPCACKVPVKILLRICIAFWSLFKNDQDSVLWSIQFESGHQKRKQWFLQGPSHTMESGFCVAYLDSINIH